MTNEELEAKVVELGKEMTAAQLMGKPLTELMASTLEQYRCKTRHLYHFPRAAQELLAQR
jgi:hypothetical protein